MCGEQFGEEPQALLISWPRLVYLFTLFCKDLLCSWFHFGSRTFICMCNIFVFGHTRPFPVCVVAVAVLSTTCQLFIVLRVWALTFISFFTTSPRLVTRADPFDAMCRCVGQILAPWDGWTWTYTVLRIYKPWHPILTVSSLETFLFWSRQGSFLGLACFHGSGYRV